MMARDGKTYLSDVLDNDGIQILLLIINGKNKIAFAKWMYLDEILRKIDFLPENDYEAIIGKYIEMNIAHPFMEGNGRATRIWLDLILRKNLDSVIDWSKIDKKEYLDAMEKSPFEIKPISELLFTALTPYTNDREIFIKGIDYSYYYEEVDEYL